MPELDLFKIFVGRMNRTGIRYMITGSMASMIYGEPRLTHDIDMVIELGRADAPKLVEAFPLEEFYCPPLEVVLVEAHRRQRGHFNLIHHRTGFKADVYLAGQDELHQWALNRRRPIETDDETFWIAPIEYVIVRKLEYFREGGSEKHLRDIQGMLSVSAEEIDFRKISELVGTFSLGKEWEKAKAPGT